MNRRPVTPEEKARMVELYNEGESLAEVATELGRSSSLVYHVLDDAEVQWHRKRSRKRRVMRTPV